VVAVGLYDARGDSAKPLQDQFSYKGLNGLSELDAQFSARTQTNVRGQAEFKNDQFKEGIFTNQDGAVIKVNHDNFRPDQADIVRAGCFDCTTGEAIIIQKSVAVAKEIVDLAHLLEAFVLIKRMGFLVLNTAVHAQTFCAL